MSVIVTGASGMLGGAIYRRLLEDDVDVHGWSNWRTQAPDDHFFSPRGTSHSIGDADLVIHCAAMTDADAAESFAEKAFMINTVWAGRLAASARERGARFIYVSTDAVYDGERPGLRSEDEAPNPLSVYAKTKLMGEQAVLLMNPEATIVRTTMVGWVLPTKREKFAEQIIRELINGSRLTLFRDAIFSPLHVGDLADYLISLAEIEHSGVLNVGSQAPISKFAFGLMVAQRFGLDSSPIYPTSVDDVPLAAKRTKNTGLDVRQAKDLLGDLPTVSQAIERLYREHNDGTVERLKGQPWPN